mmetsp:Transcript_9340/g.33011  ORF Transcript_9340/g.33011 Transcript_9340/m.33011 type:complete len:120 (+) Transcript_9340:344-703(+)
MICASGPAASAASTENSPHCTIWPSAEMTATLSHFLINARLCVTTKVVGRPGLGASTASDSSAAVAASRAEVGSSSSKIGALRAKTRASDNRWRSPPERRAPARPTGDAYAPCLVTTKP